MKQYCSNCNKIGHTLKQCNEPITSIGIFCFKLTENIKNIFSNNINYVNYYDFDNNYNLNISNIFKFNKYNKMIQFLLVKRKHSLNYIDFIKGKYDINKINDILNMLNYMSKNEVDNIKNLTFNELWNNLWDKTANSKIYNNEMLLSRDKFNTLKLNGIMDEIINISTPYDTPEWEIPKGRREYNEKNIDCAIREFKEETSLDITDYNILNCINPIHDNFTGTNNKEYKHIFYVGMAKNDTININTINNEIDEIKWCYWDEVLQLLRPYNENKIKIITSIFLFIINISEYKVISDLNATL